MKLCVSISTALDCSKYPKFLEGMRFVGSGIAGNQVSNTLFT